jgi:hypothetical protein
MMTNYGLDVMSVASGNAIFLATLLTRFDVTFVDIGPIDEAFPLIKKYSAGVRYMAAIHRLGDSRRYRSGRIPNVGKDVKLAQP